MPVKAFLEALSLLLQVLRLIPQVEGSKDVTVALRRHKERLMREKRCADRARARMAGRRR